MRTKILTILKVIVGLYIILCGLLYFIQETLLFFPQKLDQNYQFNFSQNFEELYFKTIDGKLLNGLLFKAVNTKGLIFYLHGNGGSLASWGNISKFYTDLGYDLFILDYRSYGKSEGTINCQEQLFDDNQIVYNELKKTYKEKDIIILGYSIGTGLASKLASDNMPKHLILQAPYYSLTDMMRRRFSFVPTSILKYKFETNVYLKSCEMPITIFHGNKDGVIPYESSSKLKDDFEKQIHLITLNGQGHNGMSDNEDYRRELKVLLGR
ncbi:alpha/beta hydrolase [Aquimarina pacifica]|uniref:alpha/beta hydrolase n=1 Tax=Aquimarina pacifica TaxID=1296415 RepID=UPI000470692D|nr:alpha/beta hydrolase [Aquimarina pacifica]